MFLKTLLPALVVLSTHTYQQKPSQCAPGEKFGDFYTRTAVPFCNTGHSLLYRCQKKENHTQWVVKQYPQDLFQQDRELEIMRFLKANPHPNIIHVEDDFLNNTIRSIILRQYKEDILDHVNNDFFTGYSLYRILWEQLCALEHLHTHKIAHLDISPENILLEEDLSSCLCDFGSAIQGKNQYQGFVGKISYAAPEVLQSAQDHSLYDPYLSDVWSLGITMFAATYGSLPFEAAVFDDPQFMLYKQTSELRCIINSFAQPHCHLRVEDGFIDLLQRMLTINPLERPHIKDLLSDPWLQNFLSQNQKTA